MPIADTVWFVAGSGGTSDFSDGTALTGMRNLAGGGLTNGAVYTYRAEHPTDKTIWENGSGAVNTGTNVLARTTIAASSTGSKIDWAVAPVVLLAAMKRDFDLLVLAANNGSEFTPATFATNLGLIRRVRQQVFTSSGTYTPSTGMLYCILECVGGGGGGGASNGATSGHGTAGGGGAGGYSRKYASAADIGASKTVTIGAGGVGGTNGGQNNGAAGGDTSVGSLCVGKGGSGGGWSQVGVQVGAGGAGGVAGTGDFIPPGASGFPGVAGSFTTMGVSGGQGASGPFGGGGRAHVGGGSATGNAATGYGAGGGGAAAYNTGTTFGGGAASSGVTIVTEFCTQ